MLKKIYTDINAIKAGLCISELEYFRENEVNSVQKYFFFILVLTVRGVTYTSYLRNVTCISY